MMEKHRSAGRNLHRDHGDDGAAVVALSAGLRRALADLLESLTQEQLATPSLCAGWDVRTVTAHVATAVSLPKRAFVTALLRHGTPHRANDAVARAQAARPVAETVETLRRHADNPFAPPVVGVRGPLTDVLVHTGDVRVPLGLPHDPPADAVRTALGFVTDGRPVGFVARGRIAGLRLVAGDLGWSWGDGPLVTGRGIDLLMAACGRTALLPRLDGDGATVLAERIR